MIKYIIEVLVSSKLSKIKYQIQPDYNIKYQIQPDYNIKYQIQPDFHIK